MTSVDLHCILRRIQSAREDPELLAKALAVYRANTPQLEATSSNEIAYWSDHSPDGDELFLFALEINGAIIGYAQFVAFKEKNFVIIDYMTVEEKHKTVGIFLLFFEQIRDYFDRVNLRYDFIVAEILQESDGIYTQSSEFWRAVMAFERFRVVDAPYHQLQLGRTKYDTDVPARLLVAAGTDMSSLRRETYLMIVETILFEHYLGWYRPFKTDEEAVAYEAKARAVFQSIKSNVGERDRVSLSPIPGVALPNGSLNGTYRSSKNFILFESLSYLVLLVVLVGSTMAFKLNATEVLFLAIGALLVRMAFLSVFMPEARSSLDASLVAFLGLLGKKNTVAGKSAKKPVRKR